MFATTGELRHLAQSGVDPESAAQSLACTVQVFVRPYPSPVGGRCQAPEVPLVREAGPYRATSLCTFVPSDLVNAVS